MRFEVIKNQFSLIIQNNCIVFWILLVVEELQLFKIAKLKWIKLWNRILLILTKYLKLLFEFYIDIKTSSGTSFYYQRSMNKAICAHLT